MPSNSTERLLTRLTDFRTHVNRELDRLILDASAQTGTGGNPSPSQSLSDIRAEAGRKGGKAAHAKKKKPAGKAATAGA